MREVSINQIPSLKKEYDEIQANKALEKITQGLEMLAQMNMDMSQALVEAMQNIKHDPVDLKPLVEAVLREKPKAESYTFVIERNSANLMTKVRAIPE